MSADADYARVVDFLAKQQLAPYVQYASHDHITGITTQNQDETIVVRTSDGKIVTGKPSLKVDVENSSFNGFDSNPVSNPVFAAHCYRATGEAASSLDGEPALKLALAPTCGPSHEYPFTTLYVDPQTMRPLEVSGTAAPGNGEKTVTVSLDQRYAAFDGRWMPSSLGIDVTGSGIMFWLNVHLREIYSDYRFGSKP